MLRLGLQTVVLLTNFGGLAMHHRFDSLCSNAQLRLHERKLYDKPSAHALHSCAAIYASGLGRYLSPQVVELAELAYVAEWLADRDDPTTHAVIAADAVRLILQQS